MLEAHRPYHKMASDPGREPPEFPLQDITAVQHAAVQHLSAVSPQPLHQLQLNLDDSADRQGQAGTGGSALHTQPSMELTGGEEFEVGVNTGFNRNGHSQALSSEESALKAVLAELHLRSSSVSPISH